MVQALAGCMARPGALQRCREWDDWLWLLKDGAPGEMTPGILPSALRAGLRPFKFAPGEFVELLSFEPRREGFL